MKHELLALAMAGLCASAMAATFSGSGGAGSSTIPGDYPSLAAAAADFSNSATPVTGDYTFLIAGDLIEPNNVAFGKDTGTNKVRIKPAVGTTPTITFTSTSSLASSAGWNGHLVIGTTSTLNKLDQLTTTSNFIIDGSNTVGGVSRDLTIKNTVAETTVGQFVIQVIGGCQNVEIRNATVVADQTTTNLVEQIAIEVNSRRVGTISYHPTGLVIDNCDLRTPNAYNGQAIVCRQNSTATSGGGAVAAGGAQANMRVTSNTITGSLRLMWLGMNSDTVIENNTLRANAKLGLQYNGYMIQQPAGGVNSVNGWTVRINNNRFAEYETVTTATSTVGSLTAMLYLSSDATSGTYDIFNNTFGGFKYNCPNTISTTGIGIYRCIVQASASAKSVMNVYHNSFNMPNFTQVTPQNEYYRYNAVMVGVTPWNGVLNVYNNIFRYEQNNGVVFDRAQAGTGTINSDHNTFYLGSTGRMACFNVTGTNATVTYPTFANWQATGRDLHSQVLNPNAPNPPATGKWISDSDLHFDADPGNLYAGTAYGLAYDIDYEARSMTLPYVGADERSTPLTALTAATDWALFE